MNKYNRTNISQYIKLSNIEISELGRNLNSLRLHNGSYVLPVPYAPYQRESFGSVENFHNAIRNQLYCIINLLTHKYLCFKNDIDDIDERFIFKTALRLFVKHFTGSSLTLREDVDLIRGLSHKSFINIKKHGSYFFNKFVRSRYDSVFVGKKARFVCLKGGLDSSHARAGLAHSAHKNAKVGLLFDLMTSMKESKLRKFFKIERVKSKENSLGKKRYNFTNHEKLRKLFNKECVRSGFHTSGERSFYKYLRELCEVLCVTCKSLYKILLKKSWTIDISDLEDMYTRVFTARMFKNDSRRRKWLCDIFERFHSKTFDDVGWECCDLLF